MPADFDSRLHSPMAKSEMPQRTSAMQDRPTPYVLPTWSRSCRHREDISRLLSMRYRMRLGREHRPVAPVDQSVDPRNLVENLEDVECRTLFDMACQQLAKLEYFRRRGGHFDAVIGENT
ncbi:hypothetical protein RHE_PF00174 (plasmid) [Rhizobium etli CFN 42]|uniref:Uncharacterized protein n=1 Tax=Rhizobium etli (strain ATCC 51251 / DSM 11541 / JCM 21823 / NBRC 15573 / CFN 42) TaxID=347834 RepID=Q2JZC1_RHIEC|nr:hypothetical protein RHE_PF00174 [Rhizobium etli CFN 42]